MVEGDDADGRTLGASWHANLEHHKQIAIYDTWIGLAIKVKFRRLPALKWSATDCSSVARGLQSQARVAGILVTKSDTPNSLGINSSSGSQCSQPMDRSCR